MYKQVKKHIYHQLIMLAVVGFGSGLIFDICVLIGFKATVDEPDIWLKIVIGCFIGVILAIFLVIIFSKIHRLRKMLKALGVENDEDAEKLLESSENISGSGEPLIFMNEEKVIDFSIMQYFNISDIMELDKKDSYELVEKEDAPSERVPVYLIKVKLQRIEKKHTSCRSITKTVLTVTKHIKNCPMLIHAMAALKT